MISVKRDCFESIPPIILSLPNHKQDIKEDWPKIVLYKKVKKQKIWVKVFIYVLLFLPLVERQ